MKVLPTVDNEDHGSSCIQLYYYTGWLAPIFHFDKGPSQGWGAMSMKATDRFNWFGITISDFDKCEGLEFVISSEDNRSWDNPTEGSSCCRGKNYYLSTQIINSEISNENNKEELLKRPIRITLGNGVLTTISRKPRILLMTDLDGTLLGHDDYLRQFNTLWLQCHVWRESMLVYSTGELLVFTTLVLLLPDTSLVSELLAVSALGRNLKDFLCAATQYELLEPNYAICGVGTEIYTFSRNVIPTGLHPHFLTSPNLSKTLDESSLLDPVVQDSDLKCPSWCPSRLDALFDPIWLTRVRTEFDRSAAEAAAKMLPGRVHINGNKYHDPWRLSLSVNIHDLQNAITDMEDESCEMSQKPISVLGSHEQKNLRFLLQQFTGWKLLISGTGEWRYLDVLPTSGGKLAPLMYLMEQHNIPHSHVLVCGDSGNDVDMFAAPGVCGCCVVNCQTELHDFLTGKSALAHLCGLQPKANVSVR